MSQVDKVTKTSEMPHARHIIPSDLIFTRQEVVRPIVYMGPDGYPKQEFKSQCLDYEDIIGVLNGHKPVSIVKLTSCPSRAHPVDRSTPTCMGKTIRNRKEWCEHIKTTCKQVGLITIPIANDIAYVCFRENLRSAAALYLLYHAEQKEDKQARAKVVPDRMFDDYIIGKLLGYNDKDIEAWYLGQALSLALSTPFEQVSKDTTSKTIVRIHHKRYTLFQKQAQGMLTKLMKCKAVTQIMKRFQEEVHH